MKEVLKNCQYFKIYKQSKFYAQLSWAWKKFYNLGARSIVLLHKNTISKFATYFFDLPTHAFQLTDIVFSIYCALW